MNPVYGHINDRLMAQLERGIVPWRQPWPEVPARNVAFGQPYGGINAITLNTAGHSSPWWLTYRQAHELGGRIQTDAQVVPAVSWKPDANGNGDVIRYANVFNLDQCVGIKAPTLETAPQREPLARAGGIIEKADLCPIHQRGCAPRYLAGADQIWMPFPEASPTPETWCHEAFKQLAHATGHPSRLNRAGGDGSLREELVTDMAASFLSNETGTLAKVDWRGERTPIVEWRTALDRDPTLFVSAATDAQRAADLTLHRLSLSVRTTTATIHRLAI